MMALLVAALGLVTSLGRISLSCGPSGSKTDVPAQPPRPRWLGGYPKTVTSIIEDALWTALAAICLQQLTGRLPGWFLPAAGLFWLLRLFNAALMISVRPPRDVTRSWALRALTLPGCAVGFWIGATALALGLPVFWAIVLIGLSWSQ